MLPEHSGGAFETATKGSRLTNKIFLDPNSPVVEKNDLAKGASGANTGMIHGGIRYLLYDVATTKLACTDSGYIQRIAPHLLFRIPFLFPIPTWDKLGRFLLEGAEIFFEAYDQFQPLKRGKPS